MKEIVSEHLDESSRDSVFEQIEKLQEERRSGVTDEFRNYKYFANPARLFRTPSVDQWTLPSLLLKKVFNGLGIKP